MEEKKNELEKREILRLSNEESNRMTKECLQTALIRLMGEKAFEKITITELVKRSGVSRTAFYRNYSSKEEILLEISETLETTFQASFENPKYLEHPKEWFADSFRLLKKYETIVRLLLDAKMPTDFGLGNSRLLDRFPNSSGRKRYRQLAAAGALTYIVREWMDTGTKESPEEMAEICFEIVFPENPG